MTRSRSASAGATACGAVLASALILVPIGGAAAEDRAAPAAPADWLMPDLAGEAGALLPSGRRARGVIEPRREAVLSSQLAARIVDMPVDDGDRFERGDLLVAFDCALEQARLAAADASRQAAGHTLESNRRLVALNSVGALEVALAAAEYARAEAEVREVRVLIEHCTVTAPFAGRVVETFVNQHESVAPGTELIDILDDGTLEVALIVSSAWLAWLRPGDTFTFRIDETGATVPGRVTMIGARIDPASQSLPVRGELLVDGADATGSLIAGMSGTAVFPEPEG